MHIQMYNKQLIRNYLDRIYTRSMVNALPRVLFPGQLLLYVAPYDYNIVNIYVNITVIRTIL